MLVLSLYIVKFNFPPQDSLNTNLQLTCTVFGFFQESQLTMKDETLDKWRMERDTLVSALGVQLQKLVSSQAEKDQLIRQLRQTNTQTPQEVSLTQR